MPVFYAIFQWDIKSRLNEITFVKNKNRPIKTDFIINILIHDHTEEIHLP